MAHTGRWPVPRTAVFLAHRCPARGHRVNDACRRRKRSAVPALRGHLAKIARQRRTGLVMAPAMCRSSAPMRRSILRVRQDVPISADGGHLPDIEVIPDQRGPPGKISQLGPGEPASSGDGAGRGDTECRDAGGRKGPARVVAALVVRRVPEVGMNRGFWAVRRPAWVAGGLAVAVAVMTVWLLQAKSGVNTATVLSLDGVDCVGGRRGPGPGAEPAVEQSGPPTG